MAFQMIHMEIAYRLLEYIPQTEYAAEFILGSVAPDAVHMNEHYAVDMKVRSHMFEGCGEWSDTQDYRRWKNNIGRILKKYDDDRLKPEFRNFTVGLCVHCLTDYYNDIKIWRALQKEYIPPMNLAEFRAAYYPEAKGIDLWLYQNSKNSKEVMELLKAAEAFDAEGLVRRDELESQRKHLLYTQYDADSVDISGYRFLSAERLESFIVSTVEDILNFLHQNDIPQ